MKMLNSTSPLLSIIIPIYNVEQYIERCLSSILKQQMEDIEVICVDDCSEDKSIDIIKEKFGQDSRLKILRNSRNRGPSFTRNRGYEESKGHYVYFVDSDDYIEDYMFSDIEDYLRCEKYDVLNFSYRVHTGIPGRSSVWPVLEEGVSTAEFTGQEGFCYLMSSDYLIIGACSRILKRSLIDKLSLRFIDGICQEDYAYTFRVLLSADRVLVLSKSYYNYCRRVDSRTTRKRSIEDVKGYFISYLDSMEFLEGKKFDSAVENSIFQFLDLYMWNIQGLLGQINRKNIIFNKPHVQNEWNSISFTDPNKRVNLETYSKKNVVIYGAGQFANRLHAVLSNSNVELDFFVVSEGTRVSYYKTHKVIPIDLCKHRLEESLVIIATHQKTYSEITHKLNGLGINCVATYDELEFYTQREDLIHYTNDSIPTKYRRMNRSPLDYSESIDINLLNGFTEIIIYGLDDNAVKLYYMLMDYAIEIIGFASSDSEEKGVFKSHAVKEIEDYSLHRNSALVIISNPINTRTDIRENLAMRGFENITSYEMIVSQLD